MKKKQTHTYNEQGQVLVLLTVGIITLLGFAGLAIDGGRVYSEKRFIQGIADTTSMTGALYIAQNLDAVTPTILAEAKAAAETRATNNGYPVGTATDVFIDPTDPDYYYVTTTIHSTVKATIGKLVYTDDIGVAAKSVARVKKVRLFALGQAMYAINTTSCGAISFSGSAVTTVTGTGIFSNSTCDNGDGSPQNSITFSGGEVNISSGVYTPGGVYMQNPDHVTAGVIDDTHTQQYFEKIDEPSCDGLSNQTKSGSTLQPGIYSSGLKVNNSDNLTLEPGLYCLDGDLSITGGVINGEGVTIFMRGDAKVSINGAEINLSAPPTADPADAWSDGDNVEWNGMLIFFSYGISRDVIINGNVDSNYIGAIYNYDGHCKLNGDGASAGFQTQVVCDTISISGGANIDFNYNAGEQYIPPVLIDLTE